MSIEKWPSTTICYSNKSNNKTKQNNFSPFSLNENRISHVILLFNIPLLGCFYHYLMLESEEIEVSHLNLTKQHILLDVSINSDWCSFHQICLLSVLYVLYLPPKKCQNQFNLVFCKLLYIDMFNNHSVLLLFFFISISGYSLWCIKTVPLLLKRDLLFE